MRIKGFILGCVFGITCTVGGMVFADTTKKKIDVVMNGVIVKVNGKDIKSNNILYQNTTYVPLRAVSEALLKDVQYDGKTKIVNINDKTLEIKVDNLETSASPSPSSQPSDNIEIPEGISIIKENGVEYVSFSNLSEFAGFKAIEYTKDIISFKKNDVKYTYEIDGVNVILYKTRYHIKLSLINDLLN